MKKCLSLIFVIVAAFAMIPFSLIAAGTAVPGHAKKYDADNNGFPDAGVMVNGHYLSVYSYDALGGYYWDLGDGRIQKNVPSVESLDQSTLTVLEYVVNYRADFGNDPYMNSGWIQNHIRARGFDYPKGATFYYLIVHRTDPRYTGNPDWAIWGEWEYFVLVESGQGNLPRVQRY